ncbi:helix-turn-helix transcriptional regulator [Micromonospora sp. 4G55]|uniref:helix-turn-helix domain-containing protein n=1 Tax=Micromonospora sp. 4G55 TaxID=2806102 RepID=UPI001A47E25E|nr:helix-turn-helix transcriptional regulator [Micromonospora sp. 4G55]MBM0256383.1 helix-turn-helix transcriptional regulator [Micromonospora sp. 4G55]
MTAVEGGHIQTATGWTADDSSFGARLALVRQRMGWGNVKEAATQCGVPAESWRTWERDNVAPRNLLDVVEKISNRSGCDYAWLLAGQRLQGHRGGNTLR